MNQDNETNEFSACETGAELILVLHHLLGIEAVEELLMAGAGTRQSLRRAADQFAGVGLKALASLLRKFARKAKLAPPIVGVGYQTKSALIVIARRRAERAEQSG
jgi:hypothetical protein